VRDDKPRRVRRDLRVKPNDGDTDRDRAERYLRHDWTRLYLALLETGCERGQAEKVAAEVVAARHARPIKRADLPEPDYAWIDGRWAPKHEEYL
jgi:hypothetical protein